MALCPTLYVSYVPRNLETPMIFCLARNFSIRIHVQMAPSACVIQSGSSSETRHGSFMVICTRGVCNTSMHMEEEPIIYQVGRISEETILENSSQSYITRQTAPFKLLHIHASYYISPDLGHEFVTVAFPCGLTRRYYKYYSEY